jgi:lysozyme
MEVIMIPGIDVSHWQLIIDWSLVAASGVKFAFLKATEYPLGKTSIWIDDTFAFNAAACKLNHILFAPYHFYRTHVAPDVQAAGFLNVVRGAAMDLPPVIDLEVAGCSGKKLCDQVKVFLTVLESELKIKPIIYTGGGFWRGQMILDKFENVLPFMGYPLWLAQWTSTWPAPVYPFAGWTFWQYSSSGRIPGIKTLVDLDWFGSSYVELARLCYPPTGQ